MIEHSTTLYDVTLYPSEDIVVHILYVPCDTYNLFGISTLMQETYALWIASLKILICSLINGIILMKLQKIVYYSFYGSYLHLHKICYCRKIYGLGIRKNYLDLQGHELNSMQLKHKCLEGENI